MTNWKKYRNRMMAVACLLAVSMGINAAEVVYRIAEYNKETGEFVLEGSGQIPKGAWAWLENDFGATTGNRYNQIPRNRQATLYLEGWRGCRIKTITLNMCSNRKSGQVGLSVSDGNLSLYTERPVDFASTAWFGQWVSKDLNVYVDVKRYLDLPQLKEEEGSITIKGGTEEGSVYLNAIAIEYDEPEGMQLESPLGWIYEKLTKKSTLNEGDEVMIYRNGCAAADLDGIETSHYLDAVPLASTTDVTSPDVLRFTLDRTTEQKTWTLTDQYGRRLGATGKQALGWNEGEIRWNIELGYDGAEISSANSNLGTLRYNAPESSYARFNLYTSKSLPLPFLYRKTGQKEPVVARSLTFQETEMTVSLDTLHLALCPLLQPANTTDKRIYWTSSNEQVATVNGGFVTLHSKGETLLTATTHDSGAQAQLHLYVTDATGICSLQGTTKHVVRKILKGNKVIITDGVNRYTLEGTR